MPKDHAGGLHTNGHKIPVEWQKDQPFAIAIVNFNFDSVDSVEDQVREALRIGRMQEFLDRYVVHHTAEVRREAIDAVVTEAAMAKNPGFRLVCMGFAAAVSAVIERTMESWARHFGVTKQDVQQGVDAVHERYQLRQNQVMRDEEARENMKYANFHPKAQVAP